MAGVWTNNWHGIKNMMIIGGVQRNGWSTIRDLNGNTLANTSNYSLGPMNPFYNSNTGGSNYQYNNAIVFGSGSATPDASDYCLGAKWTNNISRVSLSQSNSYNDTNQTKTKTVTCTVQNTGVAAVTIREWGIEANVSGNYVLLYRALLDTPVTLQQYESATFTCTLSLRLTDPA